MYKVCFVTTISLTLKSFVLDFAKALHDTGSFEIFFVCDNDPDFAKMLPEYISYKPIPMKRGVSLDGIRAVYELYRFFRKEKFDLVQYSTPNAACYASIAARMAGIPCRLYCQWGIAYVGFCGIKRTIFKIIERMVCWNSTRIEPDSFGNLHFSQSEGLYSAEKGQVIWNGSASGVNLNKFDISKKLIWREQLRKRYKIPDTAFVYIFVGRITKDKGVNELFEATKKLIEQQDNVFLLLVGNVECSENVDSTLYQWTQENARVIYCGYTNEVERYLSASDVYVLPSYREGFGSAVVEAEAMGVPVIVTDIPGPTDAMKNGETGIVVQKANAEELFNAMVQMYEQKERQDEFGKNGEIFARMSFEQKELFRQMILDRRRMIAEKCQNREK